MKLVPHFVCIKRLWHTLYFQPIKNCIEEDMPEMLLFFCNLNRKNRPEANMQKQRRKAFNILIACFLALSVFSGSALAGACLCGSACPHALQTTGITKGSFFLLHMRCVWRLCESCGLENGQSLKAPGTSLQIFYAKIPVNTFVPSDIFDDTSDNPIFKSVESVYSCIAVPSTPIYLQQLSILC
jgi:hypothetical protein